MRCFSFAKNIQPNQISVEVLRGKGQLRDIVLNEDVLTQKLELPSWLRIKHASCNVLTAKIPWMHLKSKPIELVRVTSAACADSDCHADAFSISTRFTSRSSFARTMRASSVR